MTKVLQAIGADQDGHRQKIFRYLLLFRWASLLPVLLALRATSDGLPGGDAQTVALAQTLVLAALANGLITLFSARVNRWLLAHRYLIGIDLLLTAGLVWYTGAEHSPYYLYSLAPILAASFFFGIRGGVACAAVYATLFTAVVFVLPRQSELAVAWPDASSQVLGLFMIAFLFGYTSVLLTRLHDAHTELSQRNEELARRNRDLHLIQELTLILQSSVDPVELQEYILGGVVEELGYHRALIGLYDDERRELTSWLSMQQPAPESVTDALGHTERIVVADEGAVYQALRSLQPVEVQKAGDVTPESRGQRLATGQHFLILPLVLRENPVGVLIVDHLPPDGPLRPAERASLERLAAHAGVALGSVRLCINRTQQQAVAEERNRIAADLHDSISQVLYGMAYGLDACIQLLPDQPERVKEELRKLHPVVTEAQSKMRQAIFDMRSDEIASDAFVARLHRHLHAICPARSHTLQIALPGEFDLLDSETREHLFRIVQEAMTNAGRHANARRIGITVAREHDGIEVCVEDDGEGFDLGRVDKTRRLGLRSMTERVERLGGELRIDSQPQRGTVVRARLPLGP